MSQQVQQAPAGQHSHAHPRPPQPAQQVMPPPQPDPVMQARIDADFKPVNIAVGGPSTAFAFCNTHKVEKCKQCNVDFTVLNRVSKILVTNPTLRCPPPPTVVQQKLSQAVTNMKDEGNVCLLTLSIYLRLTVCPEPIQTQQDQRSAFKIQYGSEHSRAEASLGKCYNTTRRALNCRIQPLSSSS
ncbi:hypothetical protein P692DRAFT_20135836 [Suillus brevipes Sb2]|nr:hypothetical protein P692DRAFT_20135836 [Suillus brevipes Sb2]